MRKNWLLIFLVCGLFLIAGCAPLPVQTAAPATPTVVPPTITKTLAAPTITPTSALPTIPAQPGPSPTPLGWKPLDQQMDTEHFTIRFTAEDAGYAKEIGQGLEQNINRMETDLQYTLNEKVQLKIYPDLRQMHYDLGWPDAPDWVIGNTNAAQGLIQIMSPRFFTLDRISHAAVHEVTHILSAKINSSAPIWLSEGIACYEAGQRDGVSQRIRQDRQKKIPPPAIADLQKATGEEFGYLGGYQYSFTLVEFAAKKFGTATLPFWLRSPDDFQGIFHQSPEEFYDQWLQFLEEEY